MNLSLLYAETSMKEKPERARLSFFSNAAFGFSGFVRFDLGSQWLIFPSLSLRLKESGLQRAGLGDHVTWGWGRQAAGGRGERRASREGKHVL